MTESTVIERADERIRHIKVTLRFPIPPSLGADPMESVASDWSSTTDSDSSLDKDDDDDDDDVEEQETQSTIEPLSPDFRGRVDKKRGEEEEEEEAEEDHDDDAAQVRSEIGIILLRTNRSSLALAICSPGPLLAWPFAVAYAYVSFSRFRTN